MDLPDKIAKLIMQNARAYGFELKHTSSNYKTIEYAFKALVRMSIEEAGELVSVIEAEAQREAQARRS